MDQVEETVYHPKIKTNFVSKKQSLNLYLPKFQNYNLVFFAFLSSSDSGAPEQRVNHREKIVRN